MKIETSLIVLCAAALHANAQIYTTSQAGNNAPQIAHIAGPNEQTYYDAQLFEYGYVDAERGPLNGKNVMYVHTRAVCNHSCSATGTDPASARAAGGVQDYVYILSPPGVGALITDQTIQATDPLNQNAFAAVCINGSDISSPPAGGCDHLANEPNFFPVNNNFKILVWAASDVLDPSSMFTVPYNESTVSIDNFLLLDKLGNPMSNVRYCTASGMPLPVQNGVWVPCLHAWTVAGPISAGETTAGNLSINGPLRQLYVPVTGSPHKIQVFNADSLAPTGEIAGVDAVGVTVSAKSRHGFSSSSPVVMWDAASLRVLATISLRAGVTPGAILLDPLNDLVYLFHQEAPLATILRASDGSTVGEVTLTGIAREAVTDGKGKVYAGIQSEGGYQVEILGFLPNGLLGVADHWSLAGETCSGVAMDGANAILFATCKTPPATPAPPSPNGTPTFAPPQLPFQFTAFQAGRQIPNSAIGVFAASVGAVFNSATGEVFSLQTDGTMTIVEEVNPATFLEEHFLTATTLRTRSLVLDPRTGNVIYTGEGVSSDNKVESFLYQLMQARQ